MIIVENFEYAGGFNASGIMLTAWDDGFGAVRVDLTAHHVRRQLVHGGLYTGGAGYDG